MPVDRLKKELTCSPVHNQLIFSSGHTGILITKNFKSFGLLANQTIIAAQEVSEAQKEGNG